MSPLMSSNQAVFSSTDSTVSQPDAFISALSFGHARPSWTPDLRRCYCIDLFPFDRRYTCSLLLDPRTLASEMRRLRPVGDTCASTLAVCVQSWHASPHPTRLAVLFQRHNSMLISEDAVVNSVCIDHLG